MGFITPSNYLGLGDCSCSDYVNAKGYGNCQKQKRGKAYCFVNQPSTCTDLRNSSYEDGLQFSHEACQKGQGMKIL